jgi:DNA-binding NarL/FixJ family response regulator
MVGTARHSPYPGKLTDRHMRLWRQLVIGGSNREIAQRVGLSESTVKNYFSELYRILELNPHRLQRRSKTEATIIGMGIMREHPEVFRDIG